MERLTERDGKYICIKGCTTHYADVERKGANHANAIVRLAAYEDTGLTPEEINGLQTALTELRHEVDSILANQRLVQALKEKGFPTDDGIRHIEDLLQVEKDGRLVVLPCRVGENVYDISDGTAYKTKVLSFLYYGDWACRTVSSYPDLEEFGTRIFLTREEAEAALKKVEAKNDETD